MKRGSAAIINYVLISHGVYVVLLLHYIIVNLSKLNKCISDIRVWMIKSKLKINNSTTEFIVHVHVHRSPQAKQHLSDLSVSVGDSIIAQSSKVRDISLIFDQFLNFDHYISDVCRLTHFHLRHIAKIWHLLSYDVCVQLTCIHALISIRLDYCNSMLYNLPKSSIERLQKIQKMAARILTKAPRCDHISEVLVLDYIG